VTAARREIGDRPSSGTPSAAPPSVSVTTLLIVDDHPAVRGGLAALLAPEPDLRVAASAADSGSALACAEQHAPGLALIDFHLPGEDGLGLCLRLESAVPRPGLVLYSAFADDLLAVLAAVAGADALVPKSADPDQLLAVLRAVSAGERQLAPPSPAALATVSAALEPADLPVVGMLAHRTPPSEVADTLSVSVGWLLARRWAILRRLSPRRSRRGPPTADALTPVDSELRSPTR
jgi:DNA-binding NarL/FixJ family response regulator